MGRWRSTMDRNKVILKQIIMRFKTRISLMTLAFMLSLSVYSQDLETIKSEIQNAALQEQEAFKNGKCTEVLAMMADDITFLANGNKVPSKQVIEKFCNSIPRPFKTPTVDQLAIYPLTAETGYSIKTLEYPYDDHNKMQEYVTKIWEKTDGKWKISHLHSTVKKVPLKKGLKKD